MLELRNIGLFGIIALSFSAYAQTSEEIQIPEGLYLNDHGTLVLDAPIEGMQWETIKDANTSTNPRVYEPFTLYKCLTENQDLVSLDVVNSDTGYKLKLYLQQYGQEPSLLVEKHTQEAHYGIYLNNATTIVMRSPEYYYDLTHYENGDTSLYIKNAITGQEINHFLCENGSFMEDNNFSFINQMVPEHFNFKFMTEELEKFLSASPKE